jgi:cytidylate kinase
MSTMRMPVVTIDGPNGVGKTAVARGLAGRLGWMWLSVGTVYRALAAARVDPADPPALGLTAEPAADGVLDPVVHVDAVPYREQQLTGAELGAEAALLGADARLQDVVNKMLRDLPASGLVAEGRATQQIYPDALASVYLWADARERELRATAVSGAPLDRGRERRDRARSSEPLRVRPGGIVWNSTRAELEQTVARLHRRVRILLGLDDFTIALTGPGALPGTAWLGGSGAVLPIEALGPDAVADAVAMLPASAEIAEFGACLAAHRDVLRWGNDMVSVGTYTHEGSPDQGLAGTVPWPANRYLTPDWLLTHGHFAVSADAFPDVRQAVSRLEAHRAELAAATWIPNPLALLPRDADRIVRLPPGTPADLLRSLQSGSAVVPERLRVTLPSDAPQAALSILAAAPDSAVWFAFEGEGGSE